MAAHSNLLMEEGIVDRCAKSYFCYRFPVGAECFRPNTPFGVLSGGFNPPLHVNGFLSLTGMGLNLPENDLLCVSGRTHGSAPTVNDLMVTWVSTNR